MVDLRRKSNTLANFVERNCLLAGLLDIQLVKCSFERNREFLCCKAAGASPQSRLVNITGY